MAFNIVVEPGALSDIQNAIDYYDRHQVGLGKKFIAAFEKQITYLIQNPFFRIVYKDYRALPIKKFPFIIFFYIDNNTVFIVAVFNTHQDPKRYPA